MDSIFTDKLGTNYVPSDGEIDEIKRYLSAPKAQLMGLEDEIARIQTILEDLRRKRDTILATIEGHHALISPARRLPRDVIQEIFLQCLPEKHNAIMSSLEAPLILGCICSEWRDVAFHTPQLWSSIHIPLSLHYGTTDDEVRLQLLQINVVKAWLNKSGTCPLSISLHAILGHVADEPYPETSKVLLDNLLMHVKRWKRVELNIPDEMLETLSSVSPVDDLSCLEKLDLSRYPGSNPSGFNLHNSNLLKAPNLRSLGVRFPYRNIPSLPVSWANLTELDFESGSGTESYLTPSSVLTILRQTTKLVKLRFNLGTGREVENSNQILTLPALESLAIVEHSSSGADGTMLYAKLDFPMLKRIFYQSDRQYEDDPFPLLELISSKRISLSLRSIQILEHGITTEDFQHLLHGAPALTRLSLRLTGSFSQYDMLSCLTPTTLSSECLCPLLDTIIISGNFYSEESLFKLMITRSLESIDGVRSLRRVSAKLLRTSTENRDGELALLRATGMDISLDYYGEIIDFRPYPRIGLRNYLWPLDEHYYPST